VRFPGVHAVATTPAQRLIASSARFLSRISLPDKGDSVGPRIGIFEDCSAFIHITACTLVGSPKAIRYIEGFSHFVTSMTAPTTSGWSILPGGIYTHWKAPPFHGAHPVLPVANGSCAACDLLLERRTNRKTQEQRGRPLTTPRSRPSMSGNWRRRSFDRLPQFAQSFWIPDVVPLPGDNPIRLHMYIRHRVRRWNISILLVSYQRTRIANTRNDKSTR
jgi:hypothetical protein